LSTETRKNGYHNFWVKQVRDYLPESERKIMNAQYLYYKCSTLGVNNEKTMMMGFQPCSVTITIKRYLQHDGSTVVSTTSNGGEYFFLAAELMICSSHSPGS